MLADLRDHQPFKRSKESDVKKAVENVKNKKNLDEIESKRKEEDLRNLNREVREMKKRFLEAKVKAVKNKEDVLKVKAPKKRVAIEKVESDNRKKKKLAFLLPESEVLDREGNKLIEGVKQKEADKKAAVMLGVASKARVTNKENGKVAVKKKDNLID